MREGGSWPASSVAPNEQSDREGKRWYMASPRVVSHLFNRAPATRLTPNAKAKPQAASLVKTVTPPRQAKLPAQAAAPTPASSDSVNISQAAKAAAQVPPAVGPSVQSGANHVQEIKQSPATLSDMQQALWGRSDRPSINRDTTSVKAEFKDLVLSAGDSPTLLDLVRRIVSLPPGSEVTIQGTIGDQPFEVKVDIKEDKTEVDIDGVAFSSRQAVESLLVDLRKQGVAEVAMQGFVEGEKVEAEFQAQEGKDEIKLEGFMFASQDQVLTVQASFRSLGFDEITLKGHVGDQLIELKDVTQQRD